MNNTPNPATICPNVLNLGLFDRRGTAPTNAKKARYGVMLNADNEAMNVVTVVPTLAPIIHAHAWKSVMYPMSASLTSVTAVTSDDWESMVWIRPEPNPPNLVLQLNPLVKMDPRFSVAWTKPLDIKLIPTKKQPHDVNTTIMAYNVSVIGVAAKVIG